MRVFHCSHCQNLVFFENTSCIQCGHTLAFLPDLAVIGSLESVSDTEWKSPISDCLYRLCENYTQQNICNWAVSADDPHALCRSCRLTQVVPDLNTFQEEG